MGAQRGVLTRSSYSNAAWQCIGRRSHCFKRSHGDEQPDRGDRRGHPEARLHKRATGDPVMSTRTDDQENPLRQAARLIATLAIRAYARRRAKETKDGHANGARRVPPPTWPEGCDLRAPELARSGAEQQGFESLPARAARGRARARVPR